MRIVIAAGGTAGHVVPALAVADALRAEGARVAFIGGGRAEAELVPAAGYELHQIAVEGIDRRNPLRAVRAGLRAAAALPRAAVLLRAIRPQAVLGAGGYAAGPVGLAALGMRMPLVLTEADGHLGLTNRMLAPFARRVCLPFELPGRGGPRYRVTGRPVPSAAGTVDPAQARAGFGIPADARCVVVFGGSLGARSINLAAVEGLGAGEERVLHICGRRDYGELARRRLRPGYDLRPYLDPPQFAAALGAADLVVARAGGSVFEIAAAGRPAMLVPYPHASGDHQAANARWMEQAGAAVVVADAELSPERLAAVVAELLADRGRLAGMAAAARGLARPGAARDIAGELLAAAVR
jgi:UDP-N-acetylglucosamine--N-acetylmuramyl-(pentapeptide) pyrophosphoryl-undecaprenol N-acetylglucosamine transferase